MFHRGEVVPLCRTSFFKTINIVQINEWVKGLTFPLWDKVHPWSPSSCLGTNFAPEGHVHPQGQTLVVKNWPLTLSPMTLSPVTLSPMTLSCMTFQDHKSGALHPRPHSLERVPILLHQEPKTQKIFRLNQRLLGLGRAQARARPGLGAVDIWFDKGHVCRYIVLHLSAWI
jgi:hypothetical protein